MTFIPVRLRGPWQRSMSFVSSSPAATSAACTAALTAVAMIAFAANSLLCRKALGTGAIDAASFAAIRTVAGAAMLGSILAMRGELRSVVHKDWRAAASLFAYMACFSFAYLSLSAGTGALILFGAVQLTMFAAALHSGEAFTRLSWAGLAIAVAGLVYLVLPGVTAPDPAGAILMAGAGVAWGAYSLLGRGAQNPLVATGTAFILATPAIAAVSLISIAAGAARIDLSGAMLAVAAGAIASGLGYVIWYAALRGLSATRAATAQLSVPVIAAFGGSLFLDESITARLLAASAATLAGVAVVLSQRAAKRHP